MVRKKDRTNGNTVETSMNSALNQREQPVRALLLGDSIRMGYLPYVRDASADLADVIGLEDNCEDSGNVLANLDRWLGARAWRVIHFNCCLHDIKIDRWTGICKTPLDHYRDNLRGSAPGCTRRARS